MGIIVFVSSLIPLSATIEDKVASLKEASEKDVKDLRTVAHIINDEIEQLRSELEENYQEVRKLFDSDADSASYQTLLKKINLLKNKLFNVEDKWRENVSTELEKDLEQFGFWDADEISLSQLLIEYGSSDFLYVIPQDLLSMKMSFHSLFPIPKESWGPLLEVILQHNGVGLKEVNACTRQVYTLKQDLLAVSTITTEKDHLDLLDDNARIIHIFSPQVENARNAFYFMERFKDPKLTYIYQVASKIAIVGFVKDVKRLISLCSNVWGEDEEKTLHVINSSKISSDQIIKIFRSYFNGINESGRSVISKGTCDLTVLPLPNETGVIVIGEDRLVQRAKEIIRDTEAQVEGLRETTIFWYECTHSDPIELAEILEKVYSSLITSDLGGDSALPLEQIEENYLNPNLMLEGRAKSSKSDEKMKGDSKKTKEPAHFFPYSSTNQLLMVVPRDSIAKIKEVIRRLDIPKKMVEIEVLLCERRITNNDKTGINLLKLGSNASGKKETDFSYGPGVHPSGIFEFMVKRAKSASFPAFDLSYHFLLSQEDVFVTASPSVTTINQVPAIISITDEISISTGASPVDSNGGVIFKDSYQRSQFGITISLTPTVHESINQIGDKEVFITLENDITFDTIKKDDNNKPDVYKRHVKNHVRIPNGETVVIGGLKSKTEDYKNEKIPLLGELPGLGKLFGTTVLKDKNVEMFIFIRPKVIEDLSLDFARKKDAILNKRPGDCEEIFDKIKEATAIREQIRFAKSLSLIL